MEINDLDFDVFKEMMRFIYIGRVLNFDKMVDNLLVVVDKYVLEWLKVMCEEVLCSNFLVENVVDIFVFVDLYSVE